MGAGRSRLAWQALTESLLLSVAGAILGLVIAKWSVRVALAAAPGTVPRSENIGLNTPVILFAAWRLRRCRVCSLGYFRRSEFESGCANRAQGAAWAGDGHPSNPTRSGRCPGRAGYGAAYRRRPSFPYNPKPVGRESWFQYGERDHVSSGAAAAKRPCAPEGIRIAYQRLTERIHQIPGVSAADISALVPLGGGSMKARSGLAPTSRHPWQKFRERFITRLVPNT